MGVSATAPEHGIAPPLVSVIIVDFNAGPYLERCLHQLATQTFTRFEALILDNASTDGSFNAAQGQCADPRFRFIQLGANLGFAVANNRGAALASPSAEWIACLNPDAFPEAEWLATLLGATHRHPQTRMFGSLQMDALEPRLLDGCGDYYSPVGLAWRSCHGMPATQPLPEREVFGPCAAAALYHAETFRRSGGFDESFFCYFEDVDLAFRMRLTGERCIQVTKAVVRHVGGASSGKASDFAHFHGLRNAIWCFVKNMPAPLFWLLLPAHGALLTAALLRGLVSGRFPSSFAAITAALRGIVPVWRQRRVIQSGRNASVLQVAKAMTWNPLSWPVWRRRRAAK